MLIYVYRNWVSNDKDKLEERIFEDIACNVKNIATVESMTDEACEDIEEEQASLMGVFDLMKNGYIFLEHIGKE
jgi:hypothetical protein